MQENQNECQGKQQGCTGNCDSCSQKSEPQSLIEPLNQFSNIKKVIGVVSGKGGVGKSLVTAASAVAMSRRGCKVGILDADITGPSIPRMFGIHTRARQNELGILPAETANGIKVMSVNLMLENEDTPVVWRGPVIAGAVKQFWTDVAWGELDYLFVDMPPGTGDVPLTVFQSLPLDGIVIVTSPQELVSLIVKKAYNMARMMNIPIIGIAENMSYVKCPDCGKKLFIFGKEGAETIADELKLPLLCKLPLDPAVSELVDKGEFERAVIDGIETAADAFEVLPKKPR